MDEQEIATWRDGRDVYLFDDGTALYVDEVREKLLAGAEERRRRPLRVDDLGELQARASTGSERSGSRDDCALLASRRCAGAHPLLPGHGRAQGCRLQPDARHPPDPGLVAGMGVRPPGCGVRAESRGHGPPMKTALGFYEDEPNPLAMPEGWPRLVENLGRPLPPPTGSGAESQSVLSSTASTAARSSTGRRCVLVVRMLGRYQTRGCCPGTREGWKRTRRLSPADCGVPDGSTRWRKRVEAREFARELASQGVEDVAAAYERDCRHGCDGECLLYGGPHECGYTCHPGRLLTEEDVAQAFAFKE